MLEPCIERNTNSFTTEIPLFETLRLHHSEKQACTVWLSGIKKFKGEAKDNRSLFLKQ